MELACAELGLSMSAAFTIFAKKAGREFRIPFEVSVDPFYTESNVRHLENIVMHRVINAAEAAEILGCSRQNVIDLTKRGSSIPLRHLKRAHCI